MPRESHDPFEAMHNFTPRAQQVLALARKEADRFNHHFVGTEHLLLGLIRLGNYLSSQKREEGKKYLQAGLTVTRNCFSEPYLSTETSHQGLILHSVYHKPNGWDYIPEGRKIPCGESTMWGDYHALELALLIQRMAEDKPCYAFFLQ